MPRKTKENKESKLNVPLYNIKGETVDTIKLPREIFDVKTSPKLLAQVIRVYQANQRAGTHNTKTRSQVIGSTRKIYRQKGTGRARHGDIKAPIFIGGGIAHGPKPRDYSKTLSKKTKRVAFFSVLSNKLAEGKIKVIKGLEKIEPKTKRMIELLKKLKITNTLLILPEKIENIILSARNIPYVHVSSVKTLNAYEVLRYQDILFMKEALSELINNFLVKEDRQKIEKQGEILSKRKTTKKKA